jgi:hypothetical protein
MRNTSPARRETELWRGLLRSLSIYVLCGDCFGGARHFAVRAFPQHGSPVCTVFLVKWQVHVQTP